MIYVQPGRDEAVDQADIIDGCPILTLESFDVDGSHPAQVDVVSGRVLVLTQTCDLANSKISTATVTVVHDARFLVESVVVKPVDVRGPIRAGRVFGWYFLPESRSLGLSEMLVDLRQLHTVRLDLLTTLCQRGHRRARLLPPYREHLAKHFADTFSRIGLPEPYETQS